MMLENVDKTGVISMVYYRGATVILFDDGKIKIFNNHPDIDWSEFCKDEPMSEEEFEERYGWVI